MRSSYIDNNYGELFYSLARCYKPRTVVEFGCLDGFSTSHILRGLKENAQDFNFTVYDLFEDYPFNHAQLKPLSVQFPEIQFVKQDYYHPQKEVLPEKFDFLHIDVSNTADSYRVFIELYYPRLAPGGIALLEGGSEARDNCEWMEKYNRPKIVPYLNTLKNKFQFVTLAPYPAITIFTK